MIFIKVFIILLSKKLSEDPRLVTSGTICYFVYNINFGVKFAFVRYFPARYEYFFFLIWKMIEVLPVDVIKVVLSFLPFESWLSIFLTSKLMFHSAKKAFDPSVDNNRYDI